MKIHKFKFDDKLPFFPSGLIRRGPQEFFAPVWDKLGPDVWLCGGAVVRWLEGATYNEGDFDIFKHPSKPNPFNHFPLIRESYIAETYMVEGNTIQVVKRDFDSIEDTLESFDFHARMVGIDGTYLYAAYESLLDIKEKIITQHSGAFSMGPTSFAGVVKYANRGYTISVGEARKFLAFWGVKPELLEVDHLY